MNISKTYRKQFNRSDTLVVLSSFPEKRGEVAVDNAIARYTKLLAENFPKNQKIVVISEKRRKSDKPFRLANNILIVPSYKVNSLFFPAQALKTLSSFPKAKNFLVQFEFSIYGGKRSIPGILILLVAQRMLGKNISIMLHQVVRDIGTLSGHLGLEKNRLKTKILGQMIKGFYGFVGLFCNNILVHDSFLKNRLKGLVNSKKIVVIPHGSGKTMSFSKAFRQNSRGYFGFKNSDKVVTVFGYKSWYKGTDWVVNRIGDIAKKYPNKNIKLLVAGGESPTLKGTGAYKQYIRQLDSTIRSHNGSIITTGYVAEKNVLKVFAASDIIIFPYRTRMSASGALSLAWRYSKPYLASRSFAGNFSEGDIKGIQNVFEIKKSDITFDLRGESFEKKLAAILEDKSLQRKLILSSKEIVLQRAWKNVAHLYINACMTPSVIGVKSVLKGSYSYATK